MASVHENVHRRIFELFDLVEEDLFHKKIRQIHLDEDINQK